jgi:hypothetical protein
MGADVHDLLHLTVEVIPQKASRRNPLQIGFCLLTLSIPSRFAHLVEFVVGAPNVPCK